LPDTNPPLSLTLNDITINYLDRGEYPCDIPFYLKVLTDFISELKLESLTMVGHSMGGMLSVLYAQANKEKIKRLVLLAPAGFEKFTEQELGLVKTFILTFTNFQRKLNF